MLDLVCGLLLCCLLAPCAWRVGAGGLAWALVWSCAGPLRPCPQEASPYLGLCSGCPWVMDSSGPSCSLSLVSLSRSFPQLYCQTLFSCLLAGFMISFVMSKMCLVFVSFVTSFTCSCVMAQGCGISSPFPGDANAAFL